MLVTCNVVDLQSPYVVVYERGLKEITWSSEVLYACACTSKLCVVQLELACPQSLLNYTLRLSCWILLYVIILIWQLHQESRLSTLDLILYTWWKNLVPRSFNFLLHFVVVLNLHYLRLSLWIFFIVILKYASMCCYFAFTVWLRTFLQHHWTSPSLFFPFSLHWTYSYPPLLLFLLA